MLLTKLVLFSLVALLPLQTAAQTTSNPKQELNDQLFEAVRKGDLAAATAALDHGADVNAKFRYGTTALFKAAERGNAPIIKLLLDRGADVKVEDTFYHTTAMTWALDGKHTECVKLLLEKDNSGVDDVLMTGVNEGKDDFVKIALDRGGVTAPTLTAAFALASADEKKAAIADMLKKAGAKPPFEVDAATLQTYVGKYRADQGFELSFVVKDGKLLVSLGRELQPLMALDKTTFRPLAFGGITLVFNSEGDKVTSLTFKETSRTTQLKRVE